MRLIEKSSTLKVLDIIREGVEPVSVFIDGEEHVYDSVEEAKEDMLMGMSFCDPGSSEYSRYAYILQQLEQGCTDCKDTLDEAENPENREINALIKGLLTGQTKAKNKLEKMGYTVEFDDEAYKQFGKDSFGKYVKITNNETGKQIIGSYGSRWGSHDFVTAKPVKDNSVSDNPIKKQQWQNTFHKLAGKTHPNDKIENFKKFDYKGYLDKQTPDLSEPESEFQQFKKDKAYLKDKEYEARRIDAARERLANVRSRLGKESVEESLKESLDYDCNEPNSMDTVRKHLESGVGGSILVNTYVDGEPAQDPPTKDDIGKVEYDLRVWDDGTADFEEYEVVEDPDSDSGARWEGTESLIPGEDFNINFTDEEVDKWAKNRLGITDTIKESEENIIDVEYIGRDDWDRHVVKDPKTGTYYGDANLTKIGKDKDMSTADWYTYSGNDPYEGEPYMPLKPGVKLNITNPDAMPNQEQDFEYMLLSRLKSDCDYFLGNGDGYVGHLWAGSIDKQIAKMRELYDVLEEKPDWITLEDINRYEEEMKNYKAGSKNKRYQVTATVETAPGVYETKVKGIYHSAEQASDVCGELRAQGISATYQEVD